MASLDSIYKSVVEMFSKRDGSAQERMEERKAKAIEDRDKPKTFEHLPFAIRFCCKPLDRYNLEVEVFWGAHERQGILHDTEFSQVYSWLRSQGVEKTWTMERCIDASFNFGEALYFPSDDTFLIPNETASISSFK